MRTLLLSVVFAVITFNTFAVSNLGGLILSSVKNDSTLVDSIKSTSSDENASVNKHDSLPVAEGFDKIVRKSGKIIECKVTYKNLFEITYITKGEKNESRISTSQVKEIQYADGKVFVVDNTPDKGKKDWAVKKSQQEWEKIVITSEPADVAGMKEKGPIEASFEAQKFNVDNETMERSILIMLKRKAFNLKASHVLIVDKVVNRMYGELPSMKIKAIAYISE